MYGYSINYKNNSNTILSECSELCKVILTFCRLFERQILIVHKSSEGFCQIHHFKMGIRFVLSN